MTKPSVFISYSHKDAKYQEELITHLAPYVRAGSVTAWSDQQIAPGSKWLDEIRAALAKTGVAVMLVSPDFLASEFIHREEFEPLLREAEKGGVTILWVLIKACGYEETVLKDYQAIVSPPEKPLAELPEALRASKWDKVCKAIKEAVSQRPSPAPSAPVKPTATPTPVAHLPHLIASSRLLDLGVTSRFEELVGREEERGILDRAWQDPDTRILTFIAPGGVGKTSLITDWMVGFVKDRWAGVDAFFDWSFYSQGTRDQGAADSSPFLDTALRHFGETALADGPAPADAKAHRLAERIAERRTLLLLDGVEPLQHPSHAAGPAGRLKDQGLERLLKYLAQLPGAGGLCVLTSRLSLVDLKRFHGRGVLEKDLANLSEPAAAYLLHQAGAQHAGGVAIAPDDPELLAAARGLGGHALAVQLLGGYLKYAEDGDIRRRDRLDWSRAFDDEQEGHIGSLMRAYEHWFDHQREPGRRQLAILRLLGLFDRPARRDLLDALRADPAIPGLTEPLAGPNQGPADWDRALIGLAEDHRLISLQRSGGAIEQVDAHPLIRAYFAHRLQQENNSAWVAGHRRLYQHLCDTTEHRPDTLEGLQPLYQAVAHGCRADLHQRACEDVYRDRILVCSVSCMFCF